MKTVSSHYLSGFYEACLSFGVSGQDLLPLIPGGQAAMHTANTRFPLECVLQILARTEKITGQKSIGLHVGTSLRPSALLEIGHALVFCSTLREAIMVNRRYQPITQQFGRTNLKTNENEAWLLWESHGLDPELERHITDAVLANHAQFGRWLTWLPGNKINAMHFRHEKPDYISKYEEVFECPIYFGQNEDAMIVDIKAIDTPLPQANEEMLHSLCKKLDVSLNAMQAPNSSEEKTAAYIREKLNTGAPSLEKTAAHFNVSPRSMRRQLALEGTSYTRILESVRRDKCEHYMIDNKYSLTKIAELLGYSEQSAFNRAFKSWHGQTPKTYMKTVKLYNIAFDQLDFAKSL